MLRAVLPTEDAMNASCSVLAWCTTALQSSYCLGHFGYSPKVVERNTNTTVLDNQTNFMSIRKLGYMQTSNIPGAGRVFVNKTEKMRNC